MAEEGAAEVATPAESHVESQAHAPVQSTTMPTAGPRAMQHAEVTELAMRIQTLEKRQRWYTVAMALIVLVAIAWPVVFSAIAMFQSSDEPLHAPQPASVGTSSTAGAAPPAHKNKPVEEAAFHSASAETDPEARP